MFPDGEVLTALNGQPKCLVIMDWGADFAKFVRTWFCGMTHSLHVDITTDDEPVKRSL